MSSQVKLDISLRNGSAVDFCQTVGQGDGPVDLIQLQNSVKKVQEDCNKALTDVINNKEKSSQNDSNSNQTTQHDDMEDEDDDEEDEDVKEPADKKLKT